MSGLFSAIGTALTALQADQQVQATTAHNIANASTPGYSVERVQLAAIAQGASGLAEAGSGVVVTGVERLRDTFLDLQYRTQNPTAQQYQTRQQALSQIETATGAPGTSSLSSVIDAFWSAWQQVANTPQDLAARQSLLGAGQSLTQGFHQLATDIATERQNLDAILRGQVAQVNELAAEIAGLNGQIQASGAAGASANDLLDQRDVLLDKLSGYLPVLTVAQPDGTVNVSSGATSVVSGENAQTLTMTNDPTNNNFAKLTWSGGGGPAAPTDGSLGALLDLRDNVLPNYTGQLDQLAAGLVAGVNGLHTTGYGLDGSTGNNFFAPGGTTAATIEVDPGIGPQQVAGAATAASVPGDGSLALKIADLNSQALVGGATVGQAYAALVEEIGGASQAAANRATNQQQLVQAITQQRQSTLGVSLDQELTNMIQTQQAYGAAAHMVSALNSMLAVLVQLGQ